MDFFTQVSNLILQSTAFFEKKEKIFLKCQKAKEIRAFFVPAPPAGP